MVAAELCWQVVTAAAVAVTYLAQGVCCLLVAWQLFDERVIKPHIL